MSPYSLHIRHSIFLVAAPALALAGALIAWNASYPSVSSAANIANVAASTSAVLAPVIAGFAAWDGLREFRHGGAPVLDTATQPAARILLLQFAAGVSYAAAVYIAIVVVLHGRGLLFTLADQPLWANLGVSFATLCLAAGWGYVTAGALRRWGAVLVAAGLPAALYGYALLGQGTGLARSLLPFGNRAGGDFLESNLPFFLGQLLFICGLLGLLIGVTAIFSSPDRWWGMTIAALALGACATGAAIVDGQDERWGVPVLDAASRTSRIASEDGSLALSVLPTYLPVKDDLLKRWERVQSIMRNTPAAFTELEQTTDSHPAPTEEVRALRTIYLNPASHSIAVHSVLESLVDLHTSSCETSMTFETSLVDIWLAGPGAEANAQLMSEHLEALAELRALDDDASRAWMSANFDAYANCTVDLSDFP